MSTVYTPKIVEPTTNTAPEDTDPLSAASAGTWLEETSDGAAWVAAGGTYVAGWHTRGTTTNPLRRLAYASADCAWFGCGSGGLDFLELSLDDGGTWFDLSASCATGKVLADVAVLPDGSVVALTGSRDVAKGTRTGYGAYSFATATNALSASPSAASVDYETDAALVVAVYRVGSSGMRIDTSPDGVLFSSVVLPAAWTGYTGASNPEVGARPGHTIALFADGSSSGIVRAVASPDGSTFTAATINLASISAAGIVAGHRITRPTYDPVTDKWFFAVSLTGSDLAEVWASADDGATWSHVRTFSGVDVEIQAAAIVGPWWVLLTTKGRVLVSKDAGSTWMWVAALQGTAGNFAVRGDGELGALAMNAGSKLCSRSGRFGERGLAL